MKSIQIFLCLIFFSIGAASEPNLDQWKDSEKTYKDLIDEGFLVKSYDINSINLENGIKILFFVTVLQKNKQVFECQEYQTLDQNMQTLDMSMMCRELVQPYQRGIGT